LHIFGVGFGGFLETIRIGDFRGYFALAINDYRLQTLGPHYRPQSTTACCPAWSSIKIGGLNRGGVQLKIAGRSDAGYALFLAVFFVQFFGKRIGAHALQTGGVDQSCLVQSLDVQEKIFAFSGLSFDNNRFDAEPGQGIGHRTTDITLFDPAGKGTFCPDRQSSGVDKRRAGEIPWCEDQFIVFSQWGHRGRHLVVDHNGGQCPAAQQ